MDKEDSVISSAANRLRKYREALSMSSGKSEFDLNEMPYKKIIELVENQNLMEESDGAEYIVKRGYRGKVLVQEQLVGEGTS